MPDISKSTTKTSRGEGQEQVSEQTSKETAKTTQDPTRQTSKEDTGAQVSTTTETPGKSESVSKDVIGPKEQTTKRPQVVSRRTEDAGDTTKTEQPTTSSRVEKEDYGIKVTIKLKLSAIH